MTTEKPQQAPQQAQEAQGQAIDATQKAQRLLAGLEAEIRGGEAALARTIHEGQEHFRQGMERATAGLQDANLDSWTHQAAAMARVGSAAGRTPAPAQGDAREDS